MIASLFFHLLGCSLLSIGLCFLGAVVAYFLQGEEIALALIEAWIFEFNGIIVGSLGYGLMIFVMRKGRAILARLDAMLGLPDELKVTLSRQQMRTTSWPWVAAISTLVTAVGGSVLWFCGFPLEGFAKHYLAICSISIYFVATAILVFFLFTLVMFHTLESASDDGAVIRFPAESMDFRLRLEKIDSFFVVTAMVGILAIYAGFRGTLTANFVETPKVVESLLVLPVILYLPGTLTYSFYPRYVLRKLAERDTIRRIEETVSGLEPGPESNPQSSLELRKLVLEVREKMMQEHRSPPVLGLKDAPSLTMSLLIVVQFIWKSDALVAAFFERFF